MKFLRNFVEGIILLIVIGAATYTQRFAIAEWFRVHTAPPLPPAVEYVEVDTEQVAGSSQDVEVSEGSLPVDPSAPKADQDDSELPSSFNLAVPFTPQAPYADWGEPYKEACEEASLYMVHAYYQSIGEGLIAAGTADEEIKKIVAFEMQLFGVYEDTTAEQTGTVAEMMYGYEKIETIENPTVEQIKTHVAAGRPVIVPAAGRELGNPFFTAPGPIYHMLVVRGYTPNGQFITNDPGTKRGEAYLYNFDTLMNAMHDWNDGGEIRAGKKVVLVVYP